MRKLKIIEKIETGAHHFLECIKIEYQDTKEAGKIVEKYIREGEISEDEEQVLKQQLVDSLKIVGVVVPFVLVPGASILMPLLIKVASKHNIELLPSAFTERTEVTVTTETTIVVTDAAPVEPAPDSKPPRKKTK